MTPPAALASLAEARTHAWIDDNGVGHRRDTVRSGCNNYGLTELVPVPLVDLDRHEVRACRDRRCFPNGFGINQYRAVA